MFGRKKKTEDVTDTPVHEERPGAKNRPTPTRREREEQRRRPLVVEDRKAAAKKAREQRYAERDRQRVAMIKGDDAHLPPRDAGPHRRLVRDVVDARFNISEWYLLLAIVAVVLVLGPQLLGVDAVTAARIQVYSTIVLWGTIILCALDAIVLSRILRRRLKARFGEDFNPRGHVSYGVMRSFQVRPWRLPKPQVKRGQAPRN